MNAVILCLMGLLLFAKLPVYSQKIKVKQKINLPEPILESNYSLEKALKNRRSVRHYAKEALSVSELGQVLWAAQGLTKPGDYKTAPSAGALYPIEMYLAVGEVRGLEPGVYQYVSKGHQLRKIMETDVRRKLSASALQQEAIFRAPVCLIIAAVYKRTTQKYGERGKKYVHMEAGHVGQNIYLQCTALNIGTVMIGAFHDSAVQEILELPRHHRPLAIMPVGKRR